MFFMFCFFSPGVIYFSTHTNAILVVIAQIVARFLADPYLTFGQAIMYAGLQGKGANGLCCVFGYVRETRVNLLSWLLTCLQPRRAFG